MNEKRVAEWMLKLVIDEHYIYQETVVYQIAEEFGEEYTYLNENGSLAISRKVLAEFKKISGDKVVWERGSRLWRLRAEYDQEGRQQD